jgi:Holliday junction resolvase RusA-like endonuclease
VLDVVFEIPIEPRGKGRPRVVSNGARGGVHAFTPAATKRWESVIALAAAPHMPTKILDEPLSVDLLLVLKRPKRLMRKADPAGFLWAPTKPDADNCRKLALDAMSSFWRDDAIVVAGSTYKVYAEKEGRPRIVMRIRSVDADPLTLSRTDIFDLVPEGC